MIAVIGGFPQVGLQQPDTRAENTVDHRTLLHHPQEHDP